VASGFIAGGALMGVISAILRYFEFNWINKEWFESHSAEILGLVMFALICAYMIWDSLRAKKEEGGGCLFDYASHVINLIQEIIGL